MILRFVIGTMIGIVGYYVSAYSPMFMGITNNPIWQYGALGIIGSVALYGIILINKRKKY